MLLSYLGIFGDKKGQKAKIFLKVGAKWVQVVALLACLLTCLLG